MNFKKLKDRSLNFIFDFDGTLVDSFQAIIKQFNFLAREFGLQTVDEESLEVLKNLNSKELIQYFKIPIYKIPEVLLKIRRELTSEMPVLSIFQGLSQVLHELHERGIFLGILTSNSFENVSAWLKKNSIDSLFEFIHIESTLFGKSRVLKRIMKSYGIDHSRALYIGDETRDIEAAHKCGMNSIAVTWGFNSEDMLQKHKPCYIARKPEDILTICDEMGYL